MVSFKPKAAHPLDLELSVYKASLAFFSPRRLQRTRWAQDIGIILTCKNLWIFQGFLHFKENIFFVSKFNFPGKRL